MSLKRVPILKPEDVFRIRVFSFHSHPPKELTIMRLRTCLAIIVIQQGAKRGYPPGSKYSCVGYGLFEDFKLIRRIALPSQELFPAN